MRELIEYLVRALVDEPGRVSVTEVPGPGHTTLEVRVAPEDVRFVVGRDGRIASALRVLAHAASRRHGRSVHPVHVEIVTPGEPD